MSTPNFFDMTDEAEKIDDTIHNLISITEDTLSENKAIFVEEDDGVLKYRPKEILKSDISDLSIEGDNNQFLLSDGANWAKSSGIFYGEIEKALFEDTRFQLTPATTEYFKIVPPDDVLGNVVISQILIKETDGETETTVYNLGTDDNLEDILTNENAVLKVILPEDQTMEQCCSVDTGNRTITLLHWSRIRQTSLGINSSLFDNTKQYKIYITSDRTLSLYCKDVLIKKGDSFIFETDKCFKEKSITDLGTFSLNQFAIKKSGDIGYHFAISDTSRLTVHGDSKVDITGNPEVFIHDNSKVHITGGASIFIHDKCTFSMDNRGSGNPYTGPVRGYSSDFGAPTFNMHDMAVCTMAKGSLLNLNDTAAIVAQGNSCLSMSDTSTHILSGNSAIVMQQGNFLGGSSYSPAIIMQGGATIVMNSRDEDYAPAFILDPNKFTFMSDGGGGNSYDNSLENNTIHNITPINIAHVSNTRWDSVNRGMNLTPANRSTSIEVADETYINIDAADGEASTYIRIGGAPVTGNTNASQLQLILTGNIFQQMSGNAHSEMHDSSKFIMRGVKTEPYWYGAPAWVAEPVEQGTGLTPLSNGPILGMYGKSVVTIGSFKDGEKSLTKYIDSIIVDPDATEAPTSYETLSETGKQAIFNLVSSPENTITGATITSTTVNPDGGFNVCIGTVSYTQYPVLETEDFSGTRTSLTYIDQYTTETPATVADLTEQSKQQVISALDFSRFVTNVVFTGGAITRNGVSFTISNLTYTCTAIPATYHLPKQEDYPYVEILDNAQLKLFNNASLTLEDDFTIQAGSNGIVFSDGMNSESFTIEELTALKALLI